MLSEITHCPRPIAPVAIRKIIQAIMVDNDGPKQMWQAILFQGCGKIIFFNTGTLTLALRLMFNVVSSII